MPEAPAAPAPIAAPAPSVSPRSSGPNMDTAFSGFDSLVAPEQPKPDEKPAEKPIDAKPDEKPLDQKPPDQKPGDKPPQQPVKPEKASTLREMATRAQAEVAEWKGKYEKLVQESSKPKPDPEKEKLVKERDEWTKARADLENEIKFANYERSAEYKKEYQQPFLKAYEQGGKLMPAITFKDPDKTDAYGEVTEAGKMRKATEADWDALMSISDEDAANKYIADHFGHNAARITVMRDRALELHSKMRTAIEDFRKQGGERETQFREAQARQQKDTIDRWHAANQRAAEKFPQLFAPDPADEKGNELLDQGRRLTDLAFNAIDPAEIAKLPQAIQAKMVNGKLPPEEMTLLHSAIRNRSAAYDRLVYRNFQKDAELKELRDKLAGYEQSEPGRGQQRRVEQKGKPGVPGSLADIDEAFDRLAAGNP